MIGVKIRNNRIFVIIMDRVQFGSVRGGKLEAIIESYPDYCKDCELVVDFLESYSKAVEIFSAFLIRLSKTFVANLRAITRMLSNRIRTRNPRLISGLASVDPIGRLLFLQIMLWCTYFLDFFIHEILLALFIFLFFYFWLRFVIWCDYNVVCA